MAPLQRNLFTASCCEPRIFKGRTSGDESHLPVAIIVRGVAYHAPTCGEQGNVVCPIWTMMISDFSV